MLIGETLTLNPPLEGVAGADLDLFVYNCTSGSCVLAGQSADGDSEESVTIANPAAGTWVTPVDGYAVPSGSTTFNYVDVFTNPAFGSVAVADANALRPAGSAWSAPGTVMANTARPPAWSCSATSRCAPTPTFWSAAAMSSFRRLPPSVQLGRCTNSEGPRRSNLARPFVLAFGVLPRTDDNASLPRSARPRGECTCVTPPQRRAEESARGRVGFTRKRRSGPATSSVGSLTARTPRHARAATSRHAPVL